MSRANPSNLIDSIRQRLLNQAKLSGQDFQLILNQFFRERFLFRLGSGEYKERYLLKGAALLGLWEKNPYRSTMDLDLLRASGGAMDAMPDEFRRICSEDVEDDGVTFDGSSLVFEPIRADQEFMGMRAHLVANLGNATTRLQIDVGNGDAAWPPARESVYPSILKMNAPRILSYAPETVIAEKYEAMVVLGIGNSRIKDFFDLSHIANLMSFEGQVLCEAIARTFAKRKTPILEQLPVGLENEYWDWMGRDQQVKAFAKRARLAITINEARQLTPFLREFLGKPVESIFRKTAFNAKWVPGGPWKTVYFAA